MAVTIEKLLLFLVICLTGKAGAQNFGIVEPFPDNIHPIEFTSAKVTCVAFDSSGRETPERIQFMRKDDLSVYAMLKANENLYFENKKTVKVVGSGIEAKNATKLSVTLHIKNVTIADDSQYGELGRYECHAFAVNDSKPRKHGFTVNVIRYNEIPKVAVSEPRTVEHNSNVIITCNLTQGEVSPRLKRISWYKNDELLQSVRNPDPQEPRDTLGPLDLTGVGVGDGGEYTCLLEVLLRNTISHNVSDTTVLRIAPWLPLPEEDTEVKKFKGESADFTCAARGNPLEVEWKVQKKGEESVHTCFNASTGRYEVTGTGIYEPYVLLIRDLEYTDRGLYYCCLPSNCSQNVDDCQRFVLRIRDPLGPLWPVIGILLEAIILFFIIFIAEKRKKSKENADKPDGRVEFSFSSTDDGDRGQVRLRKVGENTVV